LTIALIAMGEPVLLDAQPTDRILESAERAAAMAGIGQFPANGFIAERLLNKDVC
jgi:hypothetical protein